jgi:HAD superfamily hydrolase (TIGR01509 family)
MKYSFKARGHTNILATHKNTLEFTKDKELSLDGDCIVGVEADFNPAELQKLVKSNNMLRMRITAGGYSDTVEFETNKSFSSDREVVLRFSEFSSDRTFGFRATKAAKQLDRGLAERLADPAQEITIEIESLTKAIIFDFDDTIEDFKTAKEYAHKKIAEKMLDEAGVYEPSTIKILNDIDWLFSRKGMGSEPKMFDRHPWFEEYFRMIGIQVTRQKIDELVQLYWRFVIEAAKPMPGAQEVLKELKKSYKIAVLTDSDGERRLKLERAKTCGLMEYIDLFLTSDETGQNKPNKKAYDTILDKLGLKAEECIMVGDKPEVDLKLAKELGMTTVWMKHGHWAEREKRTFEYVDHEITELRQLLEMLK